MTDTPIDREAVERYTPEPWDSYRCTMAFDDCGDWVKYDDYRALLAAKEDATMWHSEACDQSSRADHAHARALVAEALEPWVDLACESLGVAGYHLNGDVAGWDEFDMPSIPADAIAAREARDVDQWNDALTAAIKATSHLQISDEVTRAILALIEKGQDQ